MGISMKKNFRFSLKFLLLASTLLALPFAWYAKMSQEAAVERGLIEELELSMTEMFPSIC